MGYAGKPDLSTNSVPPPQIEPSTGEKSNKSGLSGAVDSALDWLGRNSVLTIGDRATRRFTGDKLYPVERMEKAKTERWKAGDERLVKRYGPYPEAADVPAEDKGKLDKIIEETE